MTTSVVFKLRVENPSCAASQVLTSSACGQRLVMSFADEAREAREARVFSHV